MNIDLRKFNYDNSIDLDADVTFSEDFFKDTDIRDIKNAHVEGTLSIDSMDELIANLTVKGTFILPNSVTLDDISYDFETEIVDMYRNPEMAIVCEDLYLGNSLYLSESNGYLEPLLLTFRIEYDNYNSSKATFTTDYKRKPIDCRVYELLATVNQQSVTSPTYTFDN